ncbi:MAG: potassium transporter TrkG, partial [Ignavibacteria bacterium]|nr:potassium transporter TrkG [Ignavibacteria bacterium]
MATSLALCLILALVYKESILPFVFPILISGAAAFGSYTIIKRNSWESFNKKEAYLSVSVAWLVISVIGALPFLFSGYINSPIDALFESVSGFTTTGSSILTNIEILPKSLLFWRSLTHWIGGIGIIVLVIVIMPRANINSYSIFSLESSLREKIHPRLRSVGYRLLIIYFLLTFTETILLLLGNMNLFESLCHAFGTVSTGGFSPKNTSLTDYSPYIQYVVTIFMILGGTNFVIHYFLLKREFKKVKQNDEFVFYMKAIFISGIVITAALYIGTDRPLEQSFRDSFFQVASIVTCTGFATSDYLLWPEFAWIGIFILMFLGGSTGSTAGGIKMVR